MIVFKASLQSFGDMRAPNNITLGTLPNTVGRLACYLHPVCSSQLTRPAHKNRACNDTRHKVPPNLPPKWRAAV